MREQDNERGLSQYRGRILHGDFSPALKERITRLVTAFEVFDATGVPEIPYITAWNHDDNTVWYEFAGSQLIRLFDCNTEDLAKIFRESVVDHRVFHRVDVDDEAGIQEIVRNRRQLSGIRSGLRAEVAASGMLEADYKVSLAVDPFHIWFKDRARVETFSADRISISLGCLTDVTNEMVHKDLLKKIGYFDPLTNLPNRIIMHRSIELKIAELNRGHIEDFTFLMMDIDNFKIVNDTYGHQVGDYVLTTISELMTDGKRREDEIGRYGGEEFYGLALGVMDSGLEFAERLRQLVETAPSVFQERRIPLTISIGLVAAGELKTLSAETLIEAADRRLYEAKRKGRNQVAWQDNIRSGTEA